MKKKKVIIGAVIAVIAIAAIACLTIFLFKEDDEIDGYDRYAAQLKKGFNADIMLYGESFSFRETVDYRRIETISEVELTARQSDYHALILMDLYGGMQITDEELLLIKEFVEDKGYDMLYIGKEKLEDFVRLGFTVGVYPESYSLEYIGSNKVGLEVQQSSTGNLYAEHGMWEDTDMEYISKENTEELEDRLVWIICMHACDVYNLDKITFQPK